MKTKKKVIKRYTTCNLDEAAFLALNGLKCKAKTIDNTSSRFYFSHIPTMERLRKQYWKGGIKVNLHSWLAMRQGIKNELKSQIKLDNQKKPTSTLSPHVTSMAAINPTPFVPKLGEGYFLAIAKGIVVSNVYGHQAIHKERADAKKCFKTRADALVASATLPV